MQRPTCLLLSIGRWHCGQTLPSAIVVRYCATCLLISATLFATSCSVGNCADVQNSLHSFCLMHGNFRLWLSVTVSYGILSLHASLPMPLKWMHQPPICSSSVLMIVPPTIAIQPISHVHPRQDNHKRLISLSWDLGAEIL